MRELINPQPAGLRRAVALKVKVRMINVSPLTFSYGGEGLIVIIRATEYGGGAELVTTQWRACVYLVR